MSHSAEEVGIEILSRFFRKFNNYIIHYTKQISTGFSTVKKTIGKYKKGISINGKRDLGRKAGPSNRDLLKYVWKKFREKPKCF